VIGEQSGFLQRRGDWIDAHPCQRSNTTLPSHR
jgi:hypothetical protein